MGISKGRGKGAEVIGNRRGQEEGAKRREG